MSEEYGIKETEELLKAVGTVLIIVGPHLRDGIQLGKDVPALYAEIAAKPEVVAEVQAALKDVKVVGLELKNLSFGETIALAVPFVQRLPAILQAWSAPKVPAPVAE